MSRTALGALIHHAVWGGLWQRDARIPVPHVNLAEWAELVVVCPASATTLSRIATGDCSDLVAAVVAATRAPVIVVPSMNDAMYESPAVQANLAVLRDHGRYVSAGGTLLVVAHERGTLPGMLPVTADERRVLLPAFALVRATPTTLAGAGAQLFELQGSAG